MLDNYLEKKISLTKSELKFEDSNILIMSSKEDELMRESAAILQPKNRIVLNVGFGLGIIDTYIRNHGPKEHHIIEAHPQVCEKAKEMGFEVHCGKWEEVITSFIETGKTFDAIYFDTYVFDYKTNPQWAPFTRLVPRLLSKGGTYSYFNNIAAKVEGVEGIVQEFGWKRSSKDLKHPFDSKPYTLVWFTKNT